MASAASPTVATASRPPFASRWLPLRTLGTIACLLATFLVAGWFGYHAYLATPDTASADPLPARHAATAERAVLFIIDAFTPSKAFDPAVMPTVARLAPRGASGIIQTGPITTTAPCVYSLTTGRPGSLVQAIFNFHSAETRVDSLLSLVAARGGKIALAGDPAWHRQFAWLVPREDRHEAPEPGITVEHHIDGYDSADVDFILAKLADPAYRLLILHLGSVDAVGHMVTPLAPRYQQQLTFMDGLVARVAAAVDRDTLLLVTGDHGMAARGTHGGEEEARLTPYVLVGPGVKRGITADMPQTALPSTLGALLGLPFLPISESPPLTAILDRSPADGRSLTAEYFEAKLGAASQLGTPVGTAQLAEEQVNRQLNELLFGADSSRLVARLLTAGVAGLGILIAAVMMWRSTPADFERPSLVQHLVLAVAAPVVLAAVAAAFIWMRSSFAFRSTSIALAIIGALLIAILVVTLGLLRSPRLLARLGRWQTSLFLPVLIVLMAPLVNSHWLYPRTYFELLLLGSVTLAAMTLGRARSAIFALALTAVLIYAPRLTMGDWQETIILPLFSLAVLALAFVGSRTAPGMMALVARAALAAAFAAAWFWRVSPDATTAGVVLALFVAAVGAAIVLRADATAAAALVIGASTALFLIMASETHEALVFVGAALAAVALSRVRIDIEKPNVLYLMAAAAILLRVCLYFELGDQYNISSIRTAPGFVLGGVGTPLLSVISLLLLKYSLPWLLIFGMALPSLAAASRDATAHFVDLLTLGYVARFAAVAAVIDPLRTLPNGMDGIVGMYCVTWAEFVTFGIAATLMTALLHGVAPVPEVARARNLGTAMTASRAV